jgi:hypothetical protein
MLRVHCVRNQRVDDGWGTSSSLNVLPIRARRYFLVFIFQNVLERTDEWADELADLDSRHISFSIPLHSAAQPPVPEADRRSE